MLMHAEHLEATYGVGPHTISVPRICSADDINASDFENAISDEIFQKIVAVIRISVPYTGMIVSTRESQRSREKVLALGVSQLSGGSRTSVGGYVHEETPEENSAQFDVSDRLNPAKRKAMAVKNEKRFLKQKRNALKNPGYSRHPVKTQASFKRLLKAV